MGSPQEIWDGIGVILRNMGWRGLGSSQEEIWGGIGVTLRNMGWRVFGVTQEGDEDFGVTWGVWRHPKGEQNGVERFRVTPRRNMGWDWGHPNIYEMRSLGSS